MDETEKKKETIKAFREITVPVDAGVNGGILHIEIPFDLKLLQRFEDTMLKCEEFRWKWVRIQKSDRSIMLALREFCEPYLPKNLKIDELQPDFCMLFFSHVKGELIDSMSKSLASIISTVA